MRAKSILATGILVGLAALSSIPAHAQNSQQQDRQQQEKVRYIRDWLSIPLRESTNPDSSIVHSGVISGTPLTVLQIDEKSASSLVRTEDGKEGWIRSNYLSKEPGARNQLKKTLDELKELKALNGQLRLGAPSVALLQEKLKRQEADAQATTAKLNAEITALKGRIGDNAQLVQDHATLTQHAEQLQNEVTRLKAEVVELSAGTQQQYFRDGAIAVVAGAILTLLGANFWPRRKRTDWA